ERIQALARVPSRGALNRLAAFQPRDSGLVWAEFISDDPLGKVTWAQELAHTIGRPQGMIGLVDFSSPEIEHTFDLYTSIECVRAVRQHLGWHPTNPLLRYAPGPELSQLPEFVHGCQLS